MPSLTSSGQLQAGPRRRGRQDRHDESHDDAPQLRDDEPADIEPADIEQAVLVEDDESIEDVEDAEEGASPVFDDGTPGHDEPHE